MSAPRPGSDCAFFELSIAGFEWNVGMQTTPTSENVVVTQTRDQVDLESEDVGYRCLRALATTERMPTPGPPGTAVRFPVSCELSFGSPAYSRTSRLWSQPMRTREIQNGEGDVNHGRISVPGVRALSQQLRTSFSHYESA